MICPLVGSSKPASMRKVVVLPQPEGPSREKNLPADISAEMSSTAHWLPKRLSQVDEGDGAAGHWSLPYVVVWRDKLPRHGMAVMRR